jgi:tyrosine-protein phosphatase YwqE
LAQLTEQLDEIDYDAANQLEIVFIQAVKESKYFLVQYQQELWEAMVQLIMSIQIKGAIFPKWAKKVISESLKECLDSNDLGVSSDTQYVQMIRKAA